MSPFWGKSLHDIAIERHRRVIEPGAPEPVWLHRDAEHARILSQIRADQRESRQRERIQRGFVRRLRLVLRLA